VDTQPTIRQLVEKALYYRQITPEIENGINEILGRLGYVSDVDYEALELLIENLGLKPRRSTTALPLNMSIVYEIYARM